VKADVLYDKHYDVRLPPDDRHVPLDTWIATDDAQTREGRLYWTAGAVRWPSDLHGVASVTLPFEFFAQSHAREAARQLVTFLKTFQ
jgi:hypothetical protein